MANDILYTDEQFTELLKITNAEPNNYNALNFYLSSNLIKSHTLRRNFENTFNHDVFRTIPLNFLACIDTSNVFKGALTNILSVLDRGNQDILIDPIDLVIRNNTIRLAYIPKNITNFDIGNKIYNEDLTVTMRRKLLKANNADPDCPESDKSITIKVYGNATYYHIYFNKYSQVTLKRLFLLALELLPNIVDLKTIFNESYQSVIDILKNICEPTDNSVEDILKNMQNVLNIASKIEEEELVDTFSQQVQISMNSNRLYQIKNTLEAAESNYANTLDNLARQATALKNAQQSLLDYTEVDFSAIKTFLTKIKQYPNTRSFRKNNTNTLQFIIEEPILYTEDKIWSKYLSNSNSETRQSINYFAKNFYDTYNTTYSILNFCVQRLFKELFVDKKINIYTAANMYINKTDTVFRLYKDSLPDNLKNLFPHPHLGTNNLTCWGNTYNEIIKNINNNDGETAFLQMLYAFQQMSASDNFVVRILTTTILASEHHNKEVFKKSTEAERTTFKNIIKEFIKDETDKINTPDNVINTTNL